MNDNATETTTNLDPQETVSTLEGVLSEQVQRLLQVMADSPDNQGAVLVLAFGDPAFVQRLETRPAFRRGIECVCALAGVEKVLWQWTELLRVGGGE